MTTALEIFQWNDKYETGIDLIDQQHQRLIDLLNLLISHLAHQASFTELNTIFDQLKDYTLYHFQSEEQVWAEYFQGDEWEIEHRDVHHHFIDEVMRLKSEDRTRPLDEVIADIVSFLTHWLAYHILDNDKRMARAVLEIKRGTPLDRAKALAVEQMSGATKVLIDTLMVMSDTLAQRTVQLTREIIRRQKLEEALFEANRAKSEFLANMSHEIRTPLNAITGLVYLLQKDGVSALQADRLQKIDAAGKHLLGIINDILDLSKIEAGKMVLETRPINVIGLVDNVVAMLADRAKAKNLKLIVENEYLPDDLIGDSTRLQQNLLNYANNAIKFTESGHVTLRTLKQEEADNSILLRFEVEDTGVGIDDDAMSRLFNAFEQAGASTSRLHGGTGLGLAITKRLAELMGGDVGVRSTLGSGSTFWFTARLMKSPKVDRDIEAAATESARELLQRDYAGCRVLLVEDEEFNREVAEFILTDVNLSVDTATNGQEAVAKAAQNDYRLILMDVQLPIMDGLEATRAIRRSSKGGDVAILAMTANTFSEDKQACMDAGMNDFISKPVDPDELFKMLLKWLS